MSDSFQPQPYGLLSKEQLEVALQEKYPVGDYLNQAYALCNLVRMSEEGEKSFLNRRGPVKKLCDEMVPIGYLCKYLLSSWPKAEVQLILGSQTFDAVVSHPEGEDGLPTHIEVTGLDLTDSHLVRRALATEGHAVEVFSEKARLSEMSERLRRAIKVKSGKQYPTGTLLLIFQKTNQRLNGWMDVIVEVTEELRSELSCFKRVIVMNDHSIDLDFSPC